MKIAVSIFIFIISAGMAILFFLNVKEHQVASVIEKEPQFICGNAFFSTATSEEAKQGKRLFNANCAACHKLDAKSTGPALRFVNERFSSEDIIKFMRNDFSGKIKYTGERGYKCTPFPNVSDDDIKNILLYTH